MSKSILKKDTINKIFLSILLISILFLLTLTTLVIGFNTEGELKYYIFIYGCISIIFLFILYNVYKFIIGRVIDIRFDFWSYSLILSFSYRYFSSYLHKCQVLNNFDCNHSILCLDTHCSLTYLCAVIINDKDYGKRKSKLPGGVRPLSAVLRDQGPSGVLCGLWSELRQIHELAAPPAVERKAGEDGSGGTAQGSQGADNRQAQQQSYREDGSETAGR